MNCLSREDRQLIRRAKRDGRESRSLYLRKQIIDQKRKKGWGRGRRERIEKGSRERIEKRQKGTELTIGRGAASACCSASSRH